MQCALLLTSYKASNSVPNFCYGGSKCFEAEKIFMQPCPSLTLKRTVTRMLVVVDGRKKLTDYCENLGRRNEF